MEPASEFQIPSDVLGPVICERNSKLLSDTTLASADYRKIDLRGSIHQSKNLASTDMENKIFINSNDTLFDVLLEKWRVTGVYGVVDALISHENCPELMQTVRAKFKEFFCKVYGNDICKTKIEEETASFRRPLLVCHHNVPRIAYSLNGKEINILKLDQPGDRNQETVLKDKRIRKVTCLAWRPNSSVSVAAGSEHGILVWFLDGSIPTGRNGYSSTRHFHCKELGNNYVTSLSWNNDGTLLASSYQNSASFLVWNVIHSDYAILQRVGSPVSFLCWSSCGYHILSATDSGLFRVWETKSWTCEKWGDLNGRCETACWSNCGNILLFTMQKDPFIYYINFFKTRSDDNIEIGNADVARKCADLNQLFLDENDSASSQVEFSISNMIWDKSNSRLALQYAGQNQRSYIALFHTRIKPSLQLTPCGLIHGEKNEIPLYIDFICGFEKGAQLVVQWSNETLSLIPLYFNKNLPHSMSTVSSYPGILGNMEMPPPATYNDTYLFSPMNKSH